MEFHLHEQRLLAVMRAWLQSCYFVLITFIAPTLWCRMLSSWLLEGRSIEAAIQLHPQPES
jgi:hypothetical protein